MTDLQELKKQWLSRAKFARQKLNALHSMMKRAELLIQYLQPFQNCNELSQHVQQLQLQTQHQMTSLLSIQEEITQRIESISDMQLQSILIRRYLADETMEQIAEAMFYDVRTIIRKHKTALDALNIPIENLVPEQLQKQKGLNAMPLQEYIGTKWIEAAPMNRGDYEKHHSVIDSMLQDGSEQPSDEGYIIHHFDGCTSWSPKEIFESVYKKSGSMTFGHALNFLELGSEVRRKSWNEKKMFLTLESANDSTCSDRIWMKTADEQLIPWDANHEDILAEDWEFADKKIYTN